MNDWWALKLQSSPIGRNKTKVARKCHTEDTRDPHNSNGWVCIQSTIVPSRFERKTFFVQDVLSSEMLRIRLSRIIAGMVYTQGAVNGCHHHCTSCFSHNTIKLEDKTWRASQHSHGAVHKTRWKIWTVHRVSQGPAPFFGIYLPSF